MTASTRQKENGTPLTRRSSHERSQKVAVHSAVPVLPAEGAESAPSAHPFVRSATIFAAATAYR